MLEPTTPTNTTVNREAVNREAVKIILEEFLKSNGLNVLAIKGKWGVGKTHLVKEVLEKNQDQQEYYYASLFGIGAIEQLKSQLLNSKNPSTINQKENPSSENFISGLERIIENEYENYNYWIKFKDIYYSYIFKEITKGISALLKFFTNIVTHYRDRLDRVPKTQDIQLGGLTVPLAGVVISLAGDGLLYWLFNQIKKGSIICIDDLERKSAGFNLDELLGLIEYLVQKLECKVILIYNEEFLNEQEKSKIFLETYREKVIDIEIEMNPTVEESLDVIFKTREEFYIAIIKEVILATETNNIRVIKKIQYYINEILELISGWESDLKEQIIKNITILALAKLDKKFHDKFAFRIEDIASVIDISWEIEDKEKQNKRLEIKQNLSNIGYIPRPIDKYLIEFIDKFLFDKDEFIREGNELNETEKYISITKLLQNLLDSCYNSFGHSEQELGEKIKNFLKQYHLNLHISDFEKLKPLVETIDLDISEYERSLLEYYLENDIQSFYISSQLSAKLTQYPDLKKYLQKHKEEYKKNLDITSALNKIISYNQSPARINLNNVGTRHSLLAEEYYKLEREFLNNCTIDDYYQWLKNDYPNLIELVRYCRTVVNKDSNICLTKAIERLAKESKLKKMIAKFSYSIDIDSYPDEEHSH